MQANGTLKIWYSAVDPAWNATQVFLKEGADTRLEPITPTRVVLWPALTVLDDLDGVELRDAGGLTVARGTRDNSLPELT